MQDKEYLAQFEHCSLPKEDFRHRGHLRICWWYLNNFSPDEANAKIVTGIQRYAASLGASHIYNEALTQAWITRVREAMDKTYANFADFIAAHPELLK